jgi:hypothetical protein
MLSNGHNVNCPHLITTFSNNQLGEPLHVGVVGSAFLPASVVYRNVKAAVH